MRTEIASFARLITYPKLEDDSNCSGRPHVKGLFKDVVFIDHKFPQAARDQMSEMQSHTNPQEAQCVINIVQYLLKQSITPKQITILTPYLGQVLALRELIDTTGGDALPGAQLNERNIADLKKAGGEIENDARFLKKDPSLRVSTIDNYQGEENDIIIISLVRSNLEGNIGFLKEPERVNVMMTRARLGLILLGNVDTLLRSKAGMMWKKICANAKEVGFIGRGLPTFCSEHKTPPQLLLTQQDFYAFARDGGCDAQCKFVFPCSHPCPRKCHGKFYPHTVCNEKVYNKCTSGHILEMLCSKSLEINCKHCEEEEKARRELRKLQEQAQAMESEKEAKLKVIEMQAQAAKTKALLELKSLTDHEELKVQRVY
jgi:hypothetical protein